MDAAARQYVSEHLRKLAIAAERLSTQVEAETVWQEDLTRELESLSITAKDLFVLATVCRERKRRHQASDKGKDSAQSLLGIRHAR